MLGCPELRTGSRSVTREDHHRVLAYPGCGYAAMRVFATFGFSGALIDHHGSMLVVSRLVAWTGDMSSLL